MNIDGLKPIFAYTKSVLFRHKKLLCLGNNSKLQYHYCAMIFVNVCHVVKCWKRWLSSYIPVIFAFCSGWSEEEPCFVTCSLIFVWCSSIYLVSSKAIHKHLTYSLFYWTKHKRRHCRTILALWSVIVMAVGTPLCISSSSHTLMISDFWPNTLTTSNVRFIISRPLPPKSV